MDVHGFTENNCIGPKIHLAGPYNLLLMNRIDEQFTKCLFMEFRG